MVTTLSCFFKIIKTKLFLKIPTFPFMISSFDNDRFPSLCLSFCLFPVTKSIKNINSIQITFILLDFDSFQSQLRTELVSSELVGYSFLLSSDQPSSAPLCLGGWFACDLKFEFQFIVCCFSVLLHSQTENWKQVLGFYFGLALIALKFLEIVSH